MTSKDNKKIYILSSRKGGPLNQHKLLAEELKKLGFQVAHYNDLAGFIKMHFIYGKNKYLISNVPLFFRFTKNNFFLNIHGNYKKEKNITKNPLGFLYDINRIWSKKIIIPSPYLKNVLDIENAIIIKNAISEELINIGKNRKPISTEKEEINLAMVTMFGFKEKANGVSKVIKALSKINTSKKITLNIYGSGKYEEEVKNKSQLINLPKNIKINFNGYTNPIYDKLKEADLFVYWSDLDVMPIVFLEAMAFGLPIVTNNFPSFYDFVGKNNFISKNEEEFAENVEKLLNNPSLARKISENNWSDIENYNIKNVIKNWINLIEK
jgi:glycosyltransferase involved in cell wall biosynthesis